MGSYYINQVTGARFLNSSLTDLSGADNVGLTGWVKANAFVIAAMMDCAQGNSRNTVAAQFKVQWRNKTKYPSGTFADLGSAGQSGYIEMNYTASTDLVNDANVSTNKCDVPSGFTFQSSFSYQIEDNLSPSTDMAAGDCQEHWWGATPTANAYDGDEYEFQVYNVTSDLVLPITPTLTLITNYNLVVADASLVLTAEGNLVLVEHKTLVMADASLALSADESLVLTQDSLLEVQDSALALSADEDISLTQLHVLEMQDASLGLSADENIALVQSHILEMVDAALAISADDDFDLIQNFTLETADASLGITADDDFDLIQNSTLETADASLEITADDAFALIQHYTLEMQDASLDITADDSFELEQTECQFELIMSDGTLLLASDNIDLFQAHTLVVDDASMGIAADEDLVLVENRTLAVNNATLALSSDGNLVLVENKTLEMSDASLGLTAPNLDLTQAHILAVDNATMSLSAETPDLVQVHILAMQDATLQLTSQTPALIQNQILVVQDATLPLTAPNVVLEYYVIFGHPYIKIWDGDEWIDVIAKTAHKWHDARSFTTTGDVVVTQTDWDGSANFSAAATIQDKAVTLAKMADLASQTFIGRKTAEAGPPEMLTVADVQEMLGVVAMSGTTAEIFTINNDLTDANVDLVFGRTTGGSRTVRWDGTHLSVEGGQGSGLVDVLKLKGGADGMYTGPGLLFQHGYVSENCYMARVWAQSVGWGVDYKDDLVFDTNTGASATDLSEKMRITYRGDLLLEASALPPSNNAAYRVVQFGPIASLMFCHTPQGGFHLLDNAYYDAASVWRHRASRGAGGVYSDNGTLSLFVAPVGTADEPCDWKTVLSITGNGAYQVIAPYGIQAASPSGPAVSAVYGQLLSIGEGLHIYDATQAGKIWIGSTGSSNYIESGNGDFSESKELLITGAASAPGHTKVLGHLGCIIGTFYYGGGDDPIIQPYSMIRSLVGIEMQAGVGWESTLFGCNIDSTACSSNNKPKVLGNYGGYKNAAAISLSPDELVPAIQFWTVQGVADTELVSRMSIMGTTGYVGIVKTAPTALLHLNDVSTASLLTRNIISEGGFSDSNVRQQNLFTFQATTTANADPFDDTSGEASKNWHFGVVSDTAYQNMNRFSFIAGGIEHVSIERTGNVGIGTSGPSQLLDVRSGAVVAGTAQATQGTLQFAGYYNGTDILNTYGSEYSSAATSIGYAVRQKSGSAGIISSAGNASFQRGMLEIAGTLEYSNAASATVAIGTDVTMTSRFYINNTGNTGFNTTDIEAWNTSYRAIHLGPENSIMYGYTSGGALQLSNNAYYDSGGWKYRVSSAVATNYYQNPSGHVWRIAPAGTIDTAISWIQALFIGPTGGVDIGGTTDPGDNNLRVEGTITSVGAISGNLTGNVTGNCSGSSGSCTGNSATASGLSGCSFAQSTGRSASWGSTNGTSTGAFNAIMGTSSSATWLLSGTSGGTFRAGIQALDSDGTLRFYVGANYFSFTGATISATAFSGALTGNVTGNCSGTAGNLSAAGTKAIYMRKDSGDAVGIAWYGTSYTAWIDYMAPPSASQGPNTNVTAPSGTLVTSWAKRSFIENASGYGWTFESGTISGQPSVVAEIRSSDGSARFAGSVTAVGSLYGTEAYATNWLRSATTNCGVYNSAHGTHWYCGAAGEWNISSDSSAYPQIIFRLAHESTIRGYIYSNASGFGLLNNTGNWVFRTVGYDVYNVRMEGPVGIGKDPSYALDIQGASGSKLFRAGYSGGSYYLYGYADSGGTGISNSDPYTTYCLHYMTSNAHYFYVGSSYYMAVTTGGIVVSGAVQIGSNYALRSAAGGLVTISTSDPSGGSDGDIWIKYTA